MYKPRRFHGHVQILGLAGLCAVAAELLAAYSDSTGDVAAVLFALVFFMGLYGAPALLVRELTRRAGWGWPSLLLLCAALGVAQACVIDQSLFAERYGGYQGWEVTRQATLIPALGVSAYSAYNFILGHVIFSYGAPIAIAEGWQPHRATEPWLKPFGLIVAAVAYGGTALLIMLDPQSHSASQSQVLVSFVFILGCIALAWVIGGRTRTKRSLPDAAGQLHALAIFGLIFALATLGALAGEGWFGLSAGLMTTAAAATLLWWGSRDPSWSLRHTAAAGLGFLASRGILAFTYYPLAGSVEPFPKYAHNTVMLTAVLIAGYCALRRRVRDPADAD